MLEAASDGSDPDAALRAFEREAGVDLTSRAEHVRLGALPAVRTTAQARTREGLLALELTWVAHGGRIYRMTGATAPARVATYQAAFRRTAESFRALTPAERTGFRETRLRVVAARDGETLAQLLDRADATAWDPDMAAVANGVVASVPLPRGQLVKVARSEPYRPR